jgi:hypothetical protein
MGTVKPPDDDKTTPEQLRQSEQLLTEERRTIIGDYANYLREILKRLRKRLN